MRVANVKEKKLEDVRLPQELVDWFGILHQRIMCKGEETQFESDDCIQYGEEYFAYGGLVNKKRKLFMFTYFLVGSIKSKSSWTFYLTENQIKDIAQGRLKSLKLWACQQEGCQTKFDNQEDTCFYHDYEEDGKPDPNQLSAENFKRTREQKLDLLKKWTTEHTRSV